MQMPVKTTLRLYCDDSRLVFKCIQRHQCIATQLPCYYSFVHKNVIVKLREICMETGSTSSATKVIARYTRERGSPEANSGLSTSNLLLSSIIYYLTSKRTSQPNHVIKIEGHKIDEVQNTKFLGVYLDNKINWKRHIDYIAGKVSRAIGMITKARKFLTYESLKKMYYSFVYPFLIYCNHVWGNACFTSLKKLVLLQKKIIRRYSWFILWLFYTSFCCTLSFYKTKWWSLHSNIQDQPWENMLDL